MKTSPGHPLPLGATPLADGVNFSVVSSHARALSLCLFSPENRQIPFLEIPLHARYNKTGDVWHLFVHALPLNFYYLFRVDNSSQLLLDPYAKAVETSSIWGGGPHPTPYIPLGVIAPNPPFDWEEDTPPAIPKEQLIIYELHVRGYTRHSSSHVKFPGTFLGVIEKIPHLVELGVNAVEFMPIQEFNEQEYTRTNPLTHDRLCNYWGYSPVNFFSPMQRYASTANPQAAINEFKMVVKEFHRHGIEVILDVVYNHTAESDDEGPILCFKGLDPAVYYLFDAQGKLLDLTGCGNTLNCNHPVVRELIVKSLRYWVTEMHVDGFRFDLASILTRDTKGHYISSAPILEAISNDPILAKVKLIAEPWDAVGLYQVGSFFPHSRRWSEWNGRYRDIVRRFIKGTGHKGDFVTNLCGSQDLYASDSPCRSINFVTAHDGFTLADLVSYNHKHNIANGEGNRDGNNDNDSWNCGIEGPTTDREIQHLRQRQMRNFHLALMVSRGTPMLLMGDEYGHTKEGNNNTWCQDNALSWFQWDKLEDHQAFYRFYRLLIHFRKQHPLLYRDRFLTSEDIEWHGTALLQPHWLQHQQFIAFTLKDLQQGQDLYLAFNATNEQITVEFPSNPKGKQWMWIVNTANRAPEDFLEKSLAVEDFHYKMGSYSAVLLKAKEKN